MRRRRATFIAATVATALLATLTIGAHQADLPEPTPETCRTDLAAVFEWCGLKANSGCRYVDEEDVDVCEAGCVMAHCPEQITCTELDPMWCGKSCADPAGARFWSNSYNACSACDGMFDYLPVAEDGARYLTDAQMHAYMACHVAYMKQQCPAFTGWPQRPPRDDPAE